MGRPPLHVEETKVRLAAGQRKRIVALVGENRMAAFIRKAVEKELQLEENALGDRGTTEPGRTRLHGPDADPT